MSDGADVTSGGRWFHTAAPCRPIYYLEVEGRTVLSGVPYRTVPYVSTVGKRAFPVSGANFWNSLPSHVTCAPSLAIFRQRLKTFLFHLSYPDMIL